DALPSRLLEAREDRGVLAVVPVELDDPHPGVRRGELAEQARRRVAAAVIDEDDLVAASHLAERGRQPREERRKRPFLVEDGNEDGDLERSVRRGVHGRAPSYSPRP